MEKAPFKLNKEMVEVLNRFFVQRSVNQSEAEVSYTSSSRQVMGGPDSAYFEEYKRRCISAFKVARSQAAFVVMLLELMTFKSNFPAFKCAFTFFTCPVISLNSFIRYNAKAVHDFKRKLFLDVPEQDIDAKVEKLVRRSTY
jgi:phosphatidylinositol kinase/protein kinase (PI-3  family)